MILAGCPVHDRTLPALADVCARWAQWQCKRVRFLVVYNGPVNTRVPEILNEFTRRFEPGRLLWVMLCSGHYSGWGSLTRAQNVIRSACLEMGCSHLLFDEATRSGSAEDLEKLLSYDLPVIGALYKDSWEPGYFSVYGFDRLKQLHLHFPYRDIDRIDAPARVDGIGFGFTLIKNSVLQQVQFRSAKHAADTYFCQDLADVGIPIYAAPIFVENFKVDAEPGSLDVWTNARRRVLLQQVSNAIPGESAF